MPTTGTFRIRSGAVNFQSGLNFHGLASVPSSTAPTNAQLLTIANVYPLSAGNWYGIQSPTGGPYLGEVSLLLDSIGIFLDGATTPVADHDLPPGFEVSTAQFSTSVGGSIDAEYDLKIGALSTHFTMATSTPSMAYSGTLSLNDLLATPVGVAFTTPNSFTGLGLVITGDYLIILSWWIIPATDACGNTHASQLQYTDTLPVAPWEQLDPDDLTAAPTPTILTVTPNHGLAAGGTTITITGSGFGLDATVTLDGIDATAITVVDQFTITCTTPAHAAGSVTVVVTNPDGVST